MGWSSASSRPIGIFCSPRNVDDHFSSPTRLRMERGGTSNRLETFPHSDETQSARAPFRQDFVQVKTDPIITDGASHQFTLVAQPDLNLTGARMSGNVGQGLLDYSIKSSFHVRRQTLRNRAVQCDSQPGALCHSLDQTLEGWNEPQIVEYRRTKIVRDLSQLH